VLGNQDDGFLVALESNKNIPFEIKRVYYIWGNQQNKIRGQHAHKDLEQVVICVKGSCDFTLDDGISQRYFHLNSPNQGLYIGNNIWREFTNFSKDCVIMVVASKYYDINDYNVDYLEFKSKINNNINTLFPDDQGGGILKYSIDFPIKRIFYIYGDLKGTRGNHANIFSRFIMFPLMGSCKVDIESKKTKCSFLLNKKTMLYIDNMTWKKMYNFEKETVLMVLSDSYYTPDEYIYDYSEFKKVSNGYI
ncbi:TPA: FdtA/QdtA family cupin domain-containing protein, partial [Campylobacter jejuni]